MLPTGFLDRFESEVRFITLQTRREYEMPIQWRRPSGNPALTQAIEKSEELDQHLSESIRMLRSTQLQSPLVPTEKPQEKTAMSLTGIQSGAFDAALAAMRKKLEDRLTKGLTKIDGAAEAGAAKMDAAVDGIVAKVDKEIDDKLQEFAMLTNGGPA